MIWRICVILFSVNGRYWYKFSMHAINIARITLSHSVFTAY